MLFFIIFLLIPTYTNSMQESIPVKPSKISKILKAKRIPLAIAITPGGKKKSSKKEPAAELPGESGHRKYLGYIVRIYYLDQLQAVRAEPTKLLNLFPPPFTAPSQ